MAKSKPLDETVTEAPPAEAEAPTPGPAPEPVSEVAPTPEETEPVAVPAEPAWAPPPGHVVSDEKSYHIRVGGVRFRHVSEAPDGRWVYAHDE